ncbi:MAG: L,D-transpeptidase family protein, partial [Anaerolineae bacterium]
GFVVADALNVRARPGVADDNPPLYQVRHNQAVPVLEETTVAGSRWYRIGANQWVEGSWVGVARFKPRPSAIGPNERWVGVNLSEQTAVAYEGDRPVYAMLAATGLPGTPTVQGIFRTWLRLETGVMAGPGYYIEDVTWTCYFYSGYGLHTAYWHDAFGRPRSHGCVNLSPYDAWWIFQWSAPGGPNSPAVYVYWS